ncbi:hypothetical protein GY45DRAFT_1262141 [Cubamyces sp. BRFM 1775]|nr:hypothetical protein GY45DRAFT_1262141 [Cubamyces sp. BRFM 1775]
MIFNALPALALVAAIAGVNAQSSTSSAALPTSTGNLDTCILTCISQAASANGCSSVQDINCLCTNTKFQTDAASCLQSNCTAADVQTALGLQQAECAARTYYISHLACRSNPHTFPPISLSLR